MSAHPHLVERALVQHLRDPENLAGVRRNVCENAYEIFYQECITFWIGGRTGEAVRAQFAQCLLSFGDHIVEDFEQLVFRHRPSGGKLSVAIALVIETADIAIQIKIE